MKKNNECKTNANELFMKINNQIHEIIEKNNEYKIENSKNIDYGFQIKFSNSLNKTYTLRFYNGKKGFKIEKSSLNDDLKKILNPLFKIIIKKIDNKNYSSNSDQGFLKEIEKYEFIIGTDESGKGDYFGPLIIAGVLIKKDQISKLKNIGVCDSKEIKNDQHCIELARKIKEFLNQNKNYYDIKNINPNTYNSIYNTPLANHNLNKLLAWGHSQVIQNLLNKNKNISNFENKLVTIVDKFTKKTFLKTELYKNNININLKEIEKAEKKHIAVACSSILARANFLEELKFLSKKLEISLPKGGRNNKIIQTAKKILEKKQVYKKENIKKNFVLKDYAKLHFKTNNLVLKS